MIPHIIQKRRAEYYIHHTVCGKRRLLVETEIEKRYCPLPAAPQLQSRVRRDERGVNAGRELSAARDMTSGANPTQDASVGGNKSQCTQYWHILLPRNDQITACCFRKICKHLNMQPLLWGWLRDGTTLIRGVGNLWGISWVPGFTPIPVGKVRLILPSVSL